MNAAKSNFEPDEPDPTNPVEIGRRPEMSSVRKFRRPKHIRAGHPSVFNGKHRRRNKRYTV